MLRVSSGNDENSRVHSPGQGGLGLLFETSGGFGRYCPSPCATCLLRRVGSAPSESGSNDTWLPLVRVREPHTWVSLCRVCVCRPRSATESCSCSSPQLEPSWGEGRQVLRLARAESTGTSPRP